MKHRLIFSFKYDKRANKYVMIDDITETEARKAEMVTEIYSPSWKKQLKPQTITLILYLTNVWKGGDK
jgi:hypothetical protein